MNTKYIRKTVGVLLALALVLGLAATAYAHGVMIDYTVKSNGEIELQAAFDTGEVMNEAAVTIYSPDDPANPWLTGTADAEGRFVFTVDPEMVGTWAVQFRKAGHGDIVHIPIEAGMLDAPAVEAEVAQPADTAPVADMAAEAEEASEAETAPAIENEAESVAPAEAEAEPQTAHDDPGSSAVEVQPSLADNQESAAPDVAAPATSAEPSAAPAQAARVISSGGNVGGGGGFTTFQIILMSASVIWGFVGTALYFSNRPGEHSHHH